MNFSYNFESAVRVQLHYLIETRDWVGASAFSLEKTYPQSSASLWDDSDYIWTRIYEGFVNTAGAAVLGLDTAIVAQAYNRTLFANNTLCNNPGNPYLSQFNPELWHFNPKL